MASSTPTITSQDDVESIECDCSSGPLACMKKAYMVEPNRWAILVLTSIGALLAAVQNSALILAFPVILADLNIGIVPVFWMLLAYMMSVAALVTFMGRMGDLFGKSGVFTGGVFVFGLGGLLCGVAAKSSWGAWDIVAYRVVMAVGAAMMLGNATSLVTDAWMGPHLGIAIGISALVQAIGFAAGPLIGGALTKISWKWVFLINVPIAAAAFLACLFFLRDPKFTRSKMPTSNDVRLQMLKSFDWPGLLTMALFLIAFLTALSEEAFPSISNGAIIALWVIGCVSGVAFIGIELYRDVPMMKLALFKIRAFGVMNALVSIASVGGSCLLFAMIFFFQGPYGQDPFKAGLSVLPFGVATAIGGILSGFLADIIGVKFLVQLGLIFSGFGAVGFIWLEPSSSYGFMCGLLILVGFGNGLYNSPATKGIMASVSPQERGTATATNVLLLSFFRMVALIIVFKLAFASLPQAALIQIFLVGGGAGVSSPADVALFMNGLRICMYIAMGTWLFAALIGFFLKNDFWGTLHHFRWARAHPEEAAAALKAAMASAQNNGKVVDLEAEGGTNNSKQSKDDDETDESKETTSSASPSSSSSSNTSPANPSKASKVALHHTKKSSAAHHSDDSEDDS